MISIKFCLASTLNNILFYLKFVFCCCFFLLNFFLPNYSALSAGHPFTFPFSVYRYDAISGLPATQQSTVFERVSTGLSFTTPLNYCFVSLSLSLQASIMFNVGALYSQLAAKVVSYAVIIKFIN